MRHIAKRRTLFAIGQCKKEYYMARKVIQIISDNFLDPTAGQYCGIICLCDDGTIWSGQMTSGNVKWVQVNAPDTLETAQQPNNT